MRKDGFSKVLTIMVVALITPLMVACGSAGDSKVVTESVPETQEESEITLESLKMLLEEAEIQSAASELSDEEVIAIAEGGFGAIKELNPEEMLKRTNTELLYYMGNDEKADDTKILEVITDLVNNKTEDYNSMGIICYYVAMENVEFYDVQSMSEEELDELNDVVSDGDWAMLKEVQDYQYRIENAYKVQMNYDGMEDGVDAYMLVVYANDRWELDVCIATMRDMYQMLKEKQ